MNARLCLFGLVFFCLFSVPPASAGHPTADPFVGLYASWSQAHFLPDTKEQQLGKGFYLGLLYPEQRLTAQLRFHSWKEAQTRIIGVHYDRLWALNPLTQVFVGLEMALADLELRSRHQTPAYATGLGWGLQTGVLWSGYLPWQLEAGIRCAYFWVNEYSAPLGRLHLGPLPEGFISLRYLFQ